MRQAFMCSLIRRGILGGGLYLDGQALTYKTQKLTVDAGYRNLVLPLKEIREVTWQGVLPVAAFRMADGEEYRFLIFNKGRFIRCFEEYWKRAPENG